LNDADLASGAFGFDFVDTDASAAIADPHWNFDFGRFDSDAHAGDLADAPALDDAALPDAVTVDDESGLGLSHSSSAATDFFAKAAAHDLLFAFGSAGDARPWSLSPTGTPGSDASGFWMRPPDADRSLEATDNDGAPFIASGAVVFATAAAADTRDIGPATAGGEGGVSAPDFFAAEDVTLSGGSGQQGAPGGPTISLSTTQAAAQLTRDGYHWGLLTGLPLTISYGFRTVAPSFTVGGEDVQGTFTPFTAAEEAATRAALALWASVANITFVDLGDTNDATIEFANYSSTTDGSEAFSFLPSPPGSTGGASSMGDVFLNTYYASTTTAGDAPLGYVFMTLLHETGHSLGLEHPSSYNAGAGSLSYSANASYIQDDHQYTVMSYFSETNTGGNYSGKYPETPMLDDVAAIQRLYGANTSTATGNTTYGFNSNAGAPYAITSASQKVIFNVWDAGGNDTFDFSGYTQDQIINLNAESFSSVGGYVANVSISLGVTIENAIGGSGNDTIVGNAAANVLSGGDGDDTITGGGGNDTIDGGGGSNTAVYTSPFAAYTFTNLGSGGIRVSGGSDGTDTLTNIQFLAFSDQTVSVRQAIDAPSVVTVTGSLLLAPGGALQLGAGNLPISVTDADGDPVVTYRFTDVGTGANSPYLTVGGTAYAQGATVDVPAAQLGTVTVTGGSAGVSDTLNVQVFDGYKWSAAQNVTVATDTPPVVTAATTTFGLGLLTAASSLFKVSDADGNAITQYKITDTTVGGAHLLLAGLLQAENTPITISAALLPLLLVQTSLTNRTVNSFTVQAFDGTAWSAPTSIGVTSMNADNPSVVTVTGSVLLTPNAWMQFNTGNLPISVADADGDPVVTYRFTDANAAAGSFYMAVGSTAYAQGATVDVAAANLPNFWIHGATGNTTDALTVQVYDGYAWSAPQNVSIVTHAANHPPVVAAATTSFGLSQTVAASSIFSVSDADGDAMTQYQIVDTAAGGAALLLNGVAQAANTPVTVSAANLAQLQIQTSSINRNVSTFTVKAYDGFDWSAPTSIDVTSAGPSNTPSVVTVTGSVLLGLNKWLQAGAGNLPISVTDADGDSVVTYRFIDDSSAAGSAYMALGTTSYAQGATVDVAAANLSNFWLHSATGAETDTLTVQVFDGYAWSAPQDISVVTRNAEQAPVVTAATTNFGLSQTVAASSIFHVTDADGDAITEYQITNTTAGASTLLLNGVAQAANTPILVSAANLAQLQIATSAAKSLTTFSVQAFDGFNWSTPVSIDVTAQMGNSAPVETVTGSILLGLNAWLQFNTGNLPISVADADGDSVVTYRFTDANAAAGSFYMAVGNTAYAQGATVDIAAANLSNFWVHGASSNKTDALTVQVYDGYGWSAPQNISIVTHGPNHVPVVSAATTSFGLNQTVAASSIFSVSDADGDAMTQYQITDTAAGGSTLLLNGVAQAANTPVTVSAANLSQLQIQTSSVNRNVSTFTVKAYDGFDWSAAASIGVMSATPSNSPSVITVTGSVLLGLNKWMQLSAANLPMSVTDADGDPVVSYRFIDDSTAAASLSMAVGSASYAQGATVEVAAANLSNFWVHSATGAETDTLTVQVFDGFAWSAPQDILMVTRGAESAPVVTAATTILNASQTVAASTIFHVTDADGDAITQYRITDATVGSAHLVLNGVVQAENTPITVSAANLAQLQIATSATPHDTDQFLVSANDGFGWSTPTGITIVSGSAALSETVTAALQLTPSQWLQFNAANLPFSVTSPDGDSVVTYRFTDLGTDATSAHLWLTGGGGYVAQGGSVDVAAGQLGGLWLQGGTGAGIDTLRVQVYDGFVWSAPHDISVITGPNGNSLANKAVLGGTTGAGDVLSGTANGDVFIFAPNFGADTITNFTPGKDVIAIDHSIFANAAAALAATSDNASGNAVVHVDASDSITLQGVHTAALHLSDFYVL